MDAFGKKWSKLNPFTEIIPNRDFNLYHSALERNLRGSCKGKVKGLHITCHAGTDLARYGWVSTPRPGRFTAREVPW
jgi:hypothetical protein